jgi:serine/threonine-protein kinase
MGAASLGCPVCGATYDDARIRFCSVDGATLRDTTRRDDPLIGSTVAGRYRVDARLGSGGMGTVYRAEQVAMGREVALKVLRPEIAHDPQVQARFAREARSASQVESPFVVTLFDHGQTPDGLLFIAMELLRGQTLAEYLREHGALPWPEAVRIGRDIARALSAAHEGGVVHRDLKPENVHLGARDRAVKVLDFGIAKIVDRKRAGEDAAVTVAGAILGTPAYMSPEAAARSGNVGKPTDLYALGVILFEMVVGRAVFEEKEPVLLLGMHLRVDPERLREARPELDVPDALETLVDRLLAKEPDARPTAAETIATLDELHAAGEGARVSGPAVGMSVTADEAAPTVMDPTPVTIASVPPRPRSRALMAAGLLVAIVAAVALALMLGSEPGATARSSDPDPVEAQAPPGSAQAPEPLAPDPPLPAVEPDAGAAVAVPTAAAEPPAAAGKRPRRPRADDAPLASPPAGMTEAAPTMERRPSGGLPGLRDDW